MASRHLPRRPPAGFVSITPARWADLCAELEVNHFLREIRRGGALIAWRAAKVWYVEPDAYREVMGAWPPGYWPS